MACLLQINLPLVIHQRGARPHLVRQSGFCKDHIQLREQPVIVGDVLPMSGRLGRQLCQNPLNLLLLFHGQFPQSVVGIDSGHGLNEEGGAGGGHVVNEARHLVFELAFHRYHIPVLANGDNGLPEILGIRRGRDHLLQGLPDFGALLTHMPANV